MIIILVFFYSGLLSYHPTYAYQFTFLQLNTFREVAQSQENVPFPSYSQLNIS